MKAQYNFVTMLYSVCDEATFYFIIKPGFVEQLQKKQYWDAKDS